MESNLNSMNRDDDCKKALIDLKPDSTEKVMDMRGSSEALTLKQVSRHVCLTIKQAAKELNIGVTALKSRCRELGIPRWPHRKVKSMQALIDNVQELGKETEQVDGDRNRTALEMLQQTKKLMEERPAVMLDKKTRALRQAFYREKSKRKRLMGNGGAKKALTFEHVSRYFCLPINQAAKELNIGVTALKRRCRELGIPRWLYRKNLGKETEQVDGDRTRTVVEMLQKTKRLIEQRPAETLDEKMRHLRLVCFKEKWKRKRLMGHGAGDSPMGIGEEIRMTL